jgi:TRAP-type mannitol/chloroaromatic compound transport system permease large subunit
MDQTVRLTSMVFVILMGATAFGMVFTALHGDRLVQDFLLNLPGGQVGFLFFTMLVIFLLGFFIDFIEITFVVVPLLAPIALAFFGPELMVWFGVLVAMNLQASFLTPPFGFALFYLKGVAPPSIKTAHIYRGIVPFVLIQLIMVLVLALSPASSPGCRTWPAESRRAPRPPLASSGPVRRAPGRSSGRRTEGVSRRRRTGATRPRRSRASPRRWP